MNSAGSRPASLASWIAASAASAAPTSRAANGPFNGRVRTNTGSASPTDAARSRHGTSLIRTGPEDTARRMTHLMVAWRDVVHRTPGRRGGHEEERSGEEERVQ